MAGALRHSANIQSATSESVAAMGSIAEVSNNIAGVIRAAGETGSAATQVLGKQSVELQAQVDKFIATIRAA
jgi:hypothetical protein